MRVALVLRGGREYGAKHAQTLARQIEKHLFAEVLCLTDVAVPGVECVPLKTQWPGWWAKMELFDPAVTGDLLYLDLDTVVTGDLGEIASQKQLTCLRDFYRDGIRRPVGLGSGMMFLPEADRAEIWDAWRPKAETNISRFRLAGVGDQAWLESWSMDRWEMWQDVVPQQVVSWKVHCSPSGGKREGSVIGVPPGTRVICFHGKPRPWDVGQFKRLYE